MVSPLDPGGVHASVREVSGAISLNYPGRLDRRHGRRHRRSPQACTPGAPSRMALTLVVAPLIAMVTAGYVADAIWAAARRDTTRCSLIMLELAEPLPHPGGQPARPARATTRSARSGCCCPTRSSTCSGYWYGDAAVRWMESRTATVGGMLRWLEQAFRKWGHPLVFLFPNNPICLFAGAARMRVWVFAVLNVTRHDRAADPDRVARRRASTPDRRGARLRRALSRAPS